MLFVSFFDLPLVVVAQINADPASVFDREHTHLGASALGDCARLYQPAL